MDNSGYIALTRQSGLMKEMQLVANNIANSATTGYRRETTVFSEFVKSIPAVGKSISMTDPNARVTDTAQGIVTQTGGAFDVALEGEGFFMIETADGPRLTRAGSFSRNENSELVNYEGQRVLDAGGAPIFVPPDASQITIAEDGTIANGPAVLAQIGVYTVADPSNLTREGNVLFNFEEQPVPADTPRVLQGFLEGSNVNPIHEITRMIEVQRAYELSQNFLESEDERIRKSSENRRHGYGRSVNPRDRYFKQPLEHEHNRLQCASR